MILKICPYCQTENPEKAVFCKRCGALFRGEPQTIDTVAEKNKRKNKLIFILCLILIITAIVIILSGSLGDATVITTTTTAATTTTSNTTTTTPTTTALPAVVATTEKATTTATTLATTTSAPAVNTPAPNLSIEEICKQYNTVVGAVKSNKGNVSISKTEKINLEITHFSLPVSTSAINSFMARLIPETDLTYNFSNGIAAEDSKVSLSGFIPPSAKASPEVTPDDLISAEKDASGTIVLKFKPDTSTFADGKTVFPQYVDSATDVLDFATFSLGPVKITTADIQYPGTEIRATTDTEGKLTKLEIIQPVSVTSTGGVGSLTADVGMNLKATTTYEIK